MSAGDIVSELGFYCVCMVEKRRVDVCSGGECGSKWFGGRILRYD